MTTTTARKTTPFEKSILDGLPKALTDAGYTTEEVDDVSAFVVGYVIDNAAGFVSLVALIGQAQGELGEREIGILAALVKLFVEPSEPVTDAELQAVAADLSASTGLTFTPPPAAAVNSRISGVSQNHPGYL